MKTTAGRASVAIYKTDAKLVRVRSMMSYSSNREATMAHSSQPSFKPYGMLLGQGTTYQYSIDCNHFSLPLNASQVTAVSECGRQDQ